MIDRDIAAQTAKMTIVGKGTNQTEIAKRLGIERIFLMPSLTDALTYYRRKLSGC